MSSVPEESSIPLVRVISSSERSLQKAGSQHSVQSSRDETQNNNSPTVNGDSEESTETSTKKNESLSMTGSVSATALTKRNVNHNGEVSTKIFLLVLNKGVSNQGVISLRFRSSFFSTMFTSLGGNLPEALVGASRAWWLRAGLLVNRLSD